MSILRRMRFLAALVSVILILGLIGCKSTPEPEPQEEPSLEEPAEPEAQPEPEPEPEPELTAPVTQEEIENARSAVQRANAMGANRYFPPDYRALVTDLNDSVAMADSDPERARAALKAVIDDANELYNRTLDARHAEYVDRIGRSDAALLAIEADQFAPGLYRATRTGAAEAEAAFVAGNLAVAQTRADETLAAQSRLYHNLSENIRYVSILKRDTENYLGDAEDNEAFLYAPVELEAANNLYLDGVAAYRDYRLEDSAGILTDAKRQAVLAARTAAIRGRQSETDRLMAETQRRIEEASELQTLDAEGTVVEPRPWDGNSYLNQNPLVDHSSDVGEIEMEEPELRNLDAPAPEEEEGIPEDVPIMDEGTQVNADEQVTDYLEFAQTLWEKGVSSRNAGQFDLAQDYFRQAQAYIDIYEANAVSKTYTVVWRQTATDCLWRIADMGDIFDNPFMWPKIWRANRRLIQNPDLIYPGQVLVIPPK